MGFNFRLDKVLKFRQRLVDRQALAVAAAEAELAEITDKVAAIEMDITRRKQDPRSLPQRSVDVQDLVAKAAWLEYLLKMRARYLVAQQDAASKLADERARLTETWRDLEVLVKLKEKQHQEWRHAQDKAELKELDEIGQIRADQLRRADETA